MALIKMYSLRNSVISSGVGNWHSSMSLESLVLSSIIVSLSIGKGLLYSVTHAFWWEMLVPKLLQNALKTVSGSLLS